MLDVVAYWDNEECGPYGDDNNWDWCGANSGEACKQRVTTGQCPSGVAKLDYVEGDQHATTAQNNFLLDDCWFTYFATYSCQGTLYI